MTFIGILRGTLPAIVMLALGGSAWAQTATEGTLPRAKPSATQPAPASEVENFGGNVFSFDPISNFFRARQRPLVDHRTFRELERNRFGGDTIDPTGRYDSFFTAPETRPTQRLGQYPR